VFCSYGSVRGPPIQAVRPGEPGAASSVRAGDDQRADPNRARSGLAAFTPACWRGGYLKQPFLPAACSCICSHLDWIIVLVWMGAACILNARRC